jgi:superfamily II RNA helicase
VLAILENGNFIKSLDNEGNENTKDNKDNKDNNSFMLTTKGHIATHIREIHCLIFAELIETQALHNFSPKELVGILSCFTNITIQEEKKNMLPNTSNKIINDTILNIYNMYQSQLNIEEKVMIDTGIDYSMHFELIDYSIKWCECENEVDCKNLLQEIITEKEIFLGEFIKAILKINNISSEMEKIAELVGDMEFMAILKQIPILTLKYVATNQSLYV